MKIIPGDRYPGTSLLRNDVGRLWAFRSFINIEGYLLPFRQGLEAVALNSAEMNEYVCSTIILGYKAETFGFIEPLYCTCRHDLYLYN